MLMQSFKDLQSLVLWHYTTAGTITSPMVHLHGEMPPPMIHRNKGNPGPAPRLTLLHTSRP